MHHTARFPISLSILSLLVASTSSAAPQPVPSLISPSMACPTPYSRDYCDFSVSSDWTWPRLPWTMARSGLR